MLKAIFLLLISTQVMAADDHATISLQRWQKKIIVTIDHDKGWHTYWKNPGDSGLPSSFKFSRDKKPIEIKADEWPVPQRHIEAGDILTIGYTGRQHFFFDNEAGNLDLHVTVLICENICIPGEATLNLKAESDFIANRPAKPYADNDLKVALDTLPKESVLPKGFEYYLTRVKGENTLTLHYSLKDVKVPKLPHELMFLTGFPQPPFGFKREKLYYKDKTLYGKTEIEWDGEYQEPPMPLPADGSFSKPIELKFLLNSPHEKDVKKVTIPVKDFAMASPALDQFYKDLSPWDGKAKPAVTASTESKTMLEYLFFAFLGGLILNLMPCVLPVISLKLFGLIKHKNYPRKKILAHNISYAAGVIATFMALGGVIAALKMTGEEVGWGFQLQSPAFILVMMLILFIMSLNLFGLFEFATPGGTWMGGQQTKEGLLGDFFGGVLTTILSTPCSAPFLGTALTFAFTTSYATIFIMFGVIGLGLAFPFLLTALFPQSLAIFPKPGAWMEKLKYFLGLSLVATVIWLYDVFISLVDFHSVSWHINLLFVLWFFAFFFARKISQNRAAQFIFFALPLILTVIAVKDIEVKTDTKTEVATTSNWMPWTEEKMIAQTNKNVFVDFTAQWCLTCKVNKKLVLETDSFEEMAKKHELVLMRADWTRRDDNITQFLKKNGSVGVPAYFIQQPDGKVIALGETISIGKIEANLK